MALIIDFLKNCFPDRSGDGARVEYRLTCSGIVYDGGVKTIDWTKSYSSRILSSDHFRLVVASIPADDYPQELALSFQCPEITLTDIKERTTHSETYLPDETIAQDIAVLLTLFTRRLITVAGKVREIPAHITQGLEEYPSPIQGRIGPHWQPQPSTFIHTPDPKINGIRVEIRSYMPRELPLNRIGLNRFLGWFAEQDEDLSERRGGSA